MKLSIASVLLETARPEAKVTMVTSQPQTGLSSWSSYYTKVNRARITLPTVALVLKASIVLGEHCVIAPVTCNQLSNCYGAEVLVVTYVSCINIHFCFSSYSNYHTESAECFLVQ